MDDKEYKIDMHWQAYVNQRLSKSKRDVAISAVLTIILPLSFVALKSDFFTNITLPAIFAGSVILLIGIFGMIRISIKKYQTIKLIIVNIIFKDQLISIRTIDGQKQNIRPEKLRIYEGFRGMSKMKDIFDEPTFKVENSNDKSVYYLLSTYWENWQQIHSKLSSGNI